MKNMKIVVAFLCILLLQGCTFVIPPKSETKNENSGQSSSIFPMFDYSTATFMQEDSGITIASVDIYEDEYRGRALESPVFGFDFIIVNIGDAPIIPFNEILGHAKVYQEGEELETAVVLSNPIGEQIDELENGEVEIFCSLYTLRNLNDPIELKFYDGEQEKGSLKFDPQYLIQNGSITEDIGSYK